ncbi:calnexin-like isoform X2 [Gigantopelta aegis]|uniref:calnexin-like isoform X2 n=1 Tax=Gigantopelta aegis TaxID=1735272 RepID=UPI001B888B4E|nr:calnexin-like isoform X2 [Gigantopelta aegis]
MKLHSLLLLCVFGLLLVGLSHCDTSNDDDVDLATEDDDHDEATDEPKEKAQYIKPEPKGNTFFFEPFHTKKDAHKKWVQSQAKKDGVDETLAKYDGNWEFEEPIDSALMGDIALVLKSKAKHHAISAKLDKVYDFKGKPFIVQYEVRFANGQDCGGAYIKLLSKQSKSLDLKQLHDKTPYTVMFGPDKCGMDHKLHFIFRHKNPKTGVFEEKHAKKHTANIDSYFTDKKTHLYTLIVNPDNTFEVLVDNTVVNSGSLLSDVNPPVNPPKEIEDPNDKKPSDWDDKEKIPDPDATKPDDWDESEPEMILDIDAVKPEGWLDDEPQLVPDPAAEKPADWDEDMDGEWEAPLVENEKCKGAAGCGEWKPPTIKNPKYKGKWSAPYVDNPNYKGVWKAKIIPNPNYFEDMEPYKMTPIDALGLELWSMSDNIIFDNFIITDDRAVAEQWARDSWGMKSVEERASLTAGNSVMQAIKNATNERPWLWAVFVVVVLLPVVLIIAYCCMSKSEDVDAQRKKTDEASPDDEPEESIGDSKTNKATEHTNSTGAGGDNNASEIKKSSKADLESTTEAGDDAEEEEEEVEEEEETKNSAGDSPRKSPRKRKPRKE